MRNGWKLFVSTALSVLMALSVLGCAGTPEAAGSNASGQADGTADAALSGEIAVISREDGSGTRGAFIELTGIERKDENGDKVDDTTVDADVTNSTSVMLQSVAGNPKAIGYVSLGSMNDTVKALSIDGAEPTTENVKSGVYKIARPFNIVTLPTVSEAAQAFVAFILSAEGQAIIGENGYIAVNDAAPAFAGSTVTGKVVVAGSSSVTPVMEKLREAYLALNPNAEIEVQQSDSSTGVNMAADGTCDIGMASRSLKDSEKERGVAETAIAMDGIAVIVNNENPLTALSSEQVRSIYVGETTDWSALGE